MFMYMTKRRSNFVIKFACAGVVITIRRDLESGDDRKFDQLAQ